MCKALHSNSFALQEILARLKKAKEEEMDIRHQVIYTSTEINSAKKVLERLQTVVSKPRIITNTSTYIKVQRNYNV